MSTQTNQDKKQIILGLIIIGIIFYVGYLLIVKLWSIFSTIDPRLGAGIVAASATVIVSLISVLVSKHLDKKAEILAHLREKKVPTYEKIIEFIFNITFSEKLGKEKPTEIEMIKFMADVTQELARIFHRPMI